MERLQSIADDPFIEEFANICFDNVPTEYHIDTFILGKLLIYSY